MPKADSFLEIGQAKTDITAYVKGIGMLGYGICDNTVEEIETPLYSRAFSIKDLKSNRKIAIAVVEIAMITPSIKLGVLRKLAEWAPDLGYKADNLMLLAQHTHSASGGYSHFGFYNITIPGYVPEVYEIYINGIARSVMEADKNLLPGLLRYDCGKFDPDIDLAFNRSIRAFNANPDVEKVGPDESHFAVDRSMQLLRIEDPDGNPRGSINWFGVHTTSLSNDNHRICSDNKGFAATYLEEWYGSDFQAAFAQGTAGDVTPNYIWDAAKKWTRGKFPDDMESTRYHGQLQFDKARELTDRAAQGIRVEGELDYHHVFVDFSKVHADPEFADGNLRAWTARPALGVAFFGGTREGPGMPPFAKGLSNLLSFGVEMYEKILLYPFSTSVIRKEILHKYRVHGKKFILMEPAAKRMMGTSKIGKLVIPAFVDKSIHYLKSFDHYGALSIRSWVPEVHPLQIFRIGDLAIVGLSPEVTTVAGRRLRKTLSDALAPAGIRHLILAPYANSYCGYLTTREEYQTQCYEGGHTIFGQWQLAAFQTKLRDLALEMRKPFKDRKKEEIETPYPFSKEELSHWIHPERPQV
jgi:neutral ceramidase